MNYKWVFAFLFTVFSGITYAAEHVVEMKNNGADGVMVFEPGLLKVAVGDTVRFVPTDVGHNAESIPGMVPEGAVTWKSEFNKEYSVVIDKEGVYVYQCLPHSALGMYGVIVAGAATNLEEIKEKVKPIAAGIAFPANKGRLEKYLAGAE